MTASNHLPAGFVLTITANALSSGFYRRLEQPGAPQIYSAVAIAAGSTTVIGPFNTPRNYEITSLAGILTSSLAQSEDLEDDSTLTGTTEVEEFSGFASNLTTVSASQTKAISANSQAIVYGTLTVAGQLTIAGVLRIGPWPF